MGIELENARDDLAIFRFIYCPFKDNDWRRRCKESNKKYQSINGRGLKVITERNQVKSWGETSLLPPAACLFSCSTSTHTVTHSKLQIGAQRWRQSSFGRLFNSGCCFNGECCICTLFYLMLCMGFLLAVSHFGATLWSEKSGLVNDLLQEKWPEGRLLLEGRHQLSNTRLIICFDRISCQAHSRSQNPAQPNL